MRSEKEMLDLILSKAQESKNIRAVVMNGSRVNPNVTPDPFMDYDIVYLVDDLRPYKDGFNPTDFGDILIYERTDIEVLEGKEYSDFVCYLMQFKDGNRIDLNIAPKTRWQDYCCIDKLAVVLLDKDGIIPALPTPDESLFYTKKPTAEEFDAVFTDFWWTALYASKGLWRGQTLYALHHLDGCSRAHLLHMMEWGCAHDFDYHISFGKCSDRLKNYLPADTWERFLSSFTSTDEEQLWQALYTLCKLFSESCEKVASQHGFSYDKEIEQNVGKFMQYTHKLPRDAKELAPLL